MLRYVVNQCHQLLSGGNYPWMEDKLKTRINSQMYVFEKGPTLKDKERP